MNEPQALYGLRAAVSACRAADAQAAVNEGDAAARFAAAQQEAEANFARTIEEARAQRDNAGVEASRQREAARAAASRTQDEANQLTLRTLQTADGAMHQTHSLLSYVKGVNGVQPDSPPQPDSSITGGNPVQLLVVSAQRATALAASILQAVGDLEQVRTRRGKLLRLGIAVLVAILFVGLVFVVAMGLHRF